MRRCFLLLCVLIVVVGRAPAAEVVIDSRPTGLDAWVDQRYIGRTPLTVNLPEGTSRLRLAEARGSIFQAPLVDTLLQVTQDDSLNLFFRPGRYVAVDSEPFGLSILRDGERIGRTPMVFPIDPDRAASYRLLTPEGAIRVPSDSLIRHGRWTWRGAEPRLAPRTGAERPLWRKLGRYVLPGVAAALGVGGLLAEDSADRAYGRYLRSIDPEEIVDQYDRARRRDAWAAAFWVGAEVSLVTAVVAWIFPERDRVYRVEEDWQ